MRILSGMTHFSKLPRQIPLRQEIRYRIVPAFVEWVAAHYTGNPKPAADNKAILLQSLNKIIRASGIVSAGSRKQRRYKPLITFYNYHECFLHYLYRPLLPSVLFIDSNTSVNVAPEMLLLAIKSMSYPCFSLSLCALRLSFIRRLARFLTTAFPTFLLARNAYLLKPSLFCK